MSPHMRPPAPQLPASGTSTGEELTWPFCAGIRLLDGPLTDSMEAVAFNKHYQVNDIYSCR